LSESVIIILPLPPSCLSPNRPAGSHGGRMKRARVTSKCRRIAREAIEAERIETCPWDKIEMQAVFFHKTKVRRDGVNHNAMLKAYQDGMVDAGIAPDDDAGHWTTLPPHFNVDKDCPRVEITITKTG